MRITVLVAFCLVFVACSSSDPTPEASTAALSATAVATRAASPTGTVISRFLPLGRDTHAALVRLAASHPELSDITAEVERADVDALLARLPHTFEACAPPEHRIGYKCEALGLPEGTMIEFVQVNAELGGTRLLEDARAYLVEYLAPTTALELVAVRDDGLVILLFDRGEPGFGIVRLEFEPSSGAFGITDQSGINPLDFIRADFHRKTHTYEVLAAADSFYAKELAWKEELARSGTAFPPDYN